MIHLHLKMSHFGLRRLLDAQTNSVAHTDKFSSLMPTYLHRPPWAWKKLRKLL